MIQRIQTIYLLLAACAMALCFIFPTASIEGTTTMGTQLTGELSVIPHDVPDMYEQIMQGQDVVVGQKQFINTWPFMVIGGLACLIAVVSMFLFTNRPRQVKIVSLGFLLSVVYVFLLLFWGIDTWADAARTSMDCKDASLSYGVGTWSPMVAIVLSILAQRAIKKDEAKVRAADRLR